MATAGKRWLGLLRTQLVVLVISLVICEIGLRLLARSPIGAVLEPTDYAVPDETLGFRGNPRHPDHDPRGYRNSQALASADVVTLGDSHTYGVGVKRDEAWPAILAARIGRNVYSMAHGGYGPGQYQRMLPEALTLRPRALVVGFYLGNDLFDAFAFAKERQGKPSPPHLADLFERAAALEKEAPIGEEAMRLWAGGRPPVRGWLGDHVELYRLAHEVRKRFTAPPGLYDSFERAVAALTPSDRPYVSVVYGPEWRTILHAPYRRLAMDVSDPRILLGLELSIGALESIAARCRIADVDLLVVVIPTKESVFWPRIARPDEHPQLRELVENENAVRTRLIRHLQDSGIDVLDVLPALRAAPAQPYPEGLDGHPAAAGHLVIADRVAGWVLERRARR